MLLRPWYAFGGESGSSRENDMDVSWIFLGVGVALCGYAYVMKQVERKEKEERNRLIRRACTRS